MIDCFSLTSKEVKNISIEKIIDFYDDIYAESKKKDEIIASIRKFAKENIDILITMAPVLEYLQNSFERL